MNIPGNLAKSSLLALVIFWAVMATKEFEIDMIPFVLLSYIPIFICVALIIIGTICPIFWMTVTESFGKKNIFKKYFPYYSIVAFGVCGYGILSLESIFASAFFIAAFITVCQSWVWFAKDNRR